MERMKFETEDLSQKNIQKISELFPNCITETKDENGNLKKAIDFTKLKQMLSNDIVDDSDEKYEFTWVGKRDAMLEANKPIRKTLRPCKEESKDWDTTENLYIEGDNLEVLKLLQESYLNSIKMIYIDPPYNTGNDFIYNDDFKMSNEEYKDESGEVDEDGNRMRINTESNGRFHSDWCSMMYSRLMLARNLLADDGVIFISIDDNEQENLKKICDEVFGERNFIANICHKNRDGVSNDKIISSNHNIIMFYCKNYYTVHEKRNQYGVMRTAKDFKNYNKDDKDGRGKYTLNPVTGPGGARKGNPYYEFLGVTNYWRFSKKRMMEMYEDGRIVKINESLYQKTYMKDLLGKKKGATTWWDFVGTTSEGTKNLKDIFGNAYFDFAKPVSLVEFMLSYIENDENSIILDFFSGSATTAHAVMKVNSTDNGKRKFIMVQLPEQCDSKSAAYKSGFKNICEIGKERIRRAGELIKTDNKDKEGIEDLDIGFRVLKLDESNMKDVYYSPAEQTQILLDLFESNIKEDRTDLDLLFGCLLEWGIPLNKPYTSIKINNNTVHNYNDSDLIACFEDKLPENTIKAIANMHPLRVVFRDSSFETDSDKINAEELFKLLSPDTSVKVI